MAISKMIIEVLAAPTHYQNQQTLYLRGQYVRIIISIIYAGLCSYGDKPRRHIQRHGNM